MTHTRADHLEVVEDHVKVDRGCDADLFRQIHAQFAGLIRKGYFNAHDLLPSATQLSKKLGVNHLTVRKAFDALANEGLIYRVQGKGTYVSEAAGKPVIGIISHLNYQPQAYAQEIHAAISEKLVHAIEADGYAHRTLLLTTSRRDMYEDRWNDHDRKILEEAELRGVYLANPGVPAWFVDRCRRDDVPVVSLNGYRQDTYEVVFADREQMVGLAGEYLRQHGRSRPAIVFLDTKPGGDRSYARWLGQCLRDSGGGRFAATIPTIGVSQPTAYSGQAAAARLLRESPDIDSVVCMDDVLNMGVCWAAASLGLAVPDQLLLVSHANKGLTPPFPIPVARLECDCFAGVELARQVMNRVLNNQTIEDLPSFIEPKLVPEHVEHEERVEMYAEAV